MQGHAIEECNTSKHGDLNHGLVMVDIIHFLLHAGLAVFIFAS